MKFYILLLSIIFVPFTYGQTAEQDSTELKIQEVAVSFHNWYINAVNSNSGILNWNFAVVKGSKGKCQIDSSVYFSELRVEKTAILTTLKRSILTSHFHLPKRTI